MLVKSVWFDVSVWKVYFSILNLYGDTNAICICISQWLLQLIVQFHCWFQTWYHIRVVQKLPYNFHFYFYFPLTVKHFFFFFFLCHILIHLATLQAICDHSEGHIWPKTFDTPVIVCVTVDLHNGKRLMMILSLIACWCSKLSICVENILQIMAIC